MKVQDDTQSLQSYVRGSAIPQELINRSIGISQCITEAVNNRLSTRIIRMYAEESKRIDIEFIRI